MLYELVRMCLRRQRVAIAGEDGFQTTETATYRQKFLIGGGFSNIIH